VTRAEAIRDEERRARHVRLIANVTSSIITQGSLTRAEAEALVAVARSKILDLFPGSDETYELLYARRFRRLIDEYAGRAEAAASSAVILPFPHRSDL